jgi:tryptophan 2,3-dioxygenase
MEQPSLDPARFDQLQKLQQKYDVMGQDLSSYLEGLLYADYLTYWDYIHLDTLLSLQNPKTQFKDEKVFIVYHQITELYFNLVLWELDQITANETPTEAFALQRIGRVVRYFQHLESTFEIMVDGLDKEQFLKFRMALLPSSGFQSAQYRLIEIASTDMINLVSPHARPALQEYSDLDEQLENLYWRSGATELATGKKTLTLQQFENKYMKLFKEKGMQFRNTNLRKWYRQHFSDHAQLIELLRQFDQLANVFWPLAHLKAAGRYLQKSPEDIKATGGTNWQKYLPPRFQKIMFFPELWSEHEQEEWGKAAIAKALHAR